MALQDIARRYRGSEATEYDRQRLDAKWQAEQRIVAAFLEGVARGGSVLDAPVGTGRFLEFYAAAGLELVALDASQDMLALARSRAAELGLPAEFLRGDIRAIPARDASFDVVVCNRLLNWAASRELVTVLREIRRVTRGVALVSIRHWIPSRELALSGRLRQAWHRLRAGLRRGGWTVHEWPVVTRALTDAGFTVERSECADASDGVTRYLLYRLR